MGSGEKFPNHADQACKILAGKITTAFKCKNSNCCRETCPVNDR